MRDNGICILCIQETHLETNEYFVDDGFCIFFSGCTPPNGGRSYAGVGFIISPWMVKSVVCFQAISDRLATLRVKVRGGITTFISAYAPHSGLPFEERHAFFDQLSDLIKPRTSHSTCIVVGDLNAKLGAPRADEQTILGPFSFKCALQNIATTSNRDLLMECCRSNRLFVAASFFEQPLEAQVTYRSLTSKPMDEITDTRFAQIDHTLVPLDDYDTVLACWSSRTDALNSHHFPIFVSLAIEFDRQAKPRKCSVPNIDALRDKTECVHFGHRFSTAIKGPTESIEKHACFVQNEHDLYEILVFCAFVHRRQKHVNTDVFAVCGKHRKTCMCCFLFFSTESRSHAAA